MKLKKFVTIPDFIATNQSISPLALKVYVYLKMFDHCSPSIQEMTKGTGLSKSTVIRSIKWLLENNVIERDKGGGRSLNQYRFTGTISNAKNNE